MRGTRLNSTASEIWGLALACMSEWEQSRFVRTHAKPIER